MTDETDESGDPPAPGDTGDEDPVAGMYESNGDGPTIVPDASSSPDDDQFEDATDETDDPAPLEYGTSLLGDDEDEPERVHGTFYVKAAEETAITLHEVETTQIFVVIDNPGYEAHDIIEGTLVAQPPMEVSYLFEAVEDHRQITVEVSEEPLTPQVRDVSEQLDEMDVVALDRAGEGEIHVLRVPTEAVEETVDDLREDEMAYKNAARIEVDRVEIRSDEERGIVSVRYLP